MFIFAGSEECQRAFFRGFGKPCSVRIEQGKRICGGQGRSVEHRELFRAVRPFRQNKLCTHSVGIFRTAEFSVAGDEVAGSFQNDPHFFQVLEGQLRVFSRRDDFIGAFGSDSGNPQELFHARAVDFHGEILHVPKRPGAFRIVFRGKIFSRGSDFLRREPVKSQKPICLIQTMFPQKPRRRVGQKRVVYDGNVRGIIYPFQIIFPIHEFGESENLSVRFGRSADDHLRRLPGRKKAPRAPFFFLPRPPLVFERQCPLFFAQLPHGGKDAVFCLLRRLQFQTLFARQLDVIAHAVGVSRRAVGQNFVRMRDSFEMNIAVEFISFPKRLYRLQ